MYFLCGWYCTHALYSRSLQFIRFTRHHDLFLWVQQSCRIRCFWAIYDPGFLWGGLTGIKWWQCTFSANHEYVRIVRFYHIMFRLHLYELTVLSGGQWGWWCESSVSRLRSLLIFVATKPNTFKETPGNFAAGVCVNKTRCFEPIQDFFGAFFVPEPNQN